jgi:hypothetical protein
MESFASSLQHLESLLRFARELQGEGIGLYEHSFDAQAFGSFIVVFGRPHERVRFVWDGRESTLEVLVGKFHNSSQPANWVHERFVSLPGGQGVFEEIASGAIDILAT